MVLWIFLGILSAFLDATRLALSKKILHNSDEYIVATIPRLFMIPFFAAWLFFVPLPEINTTFWLVVIFVVIVALVANLLQLYAIKISPLSATTPFVTFTPIFLLIFSPLILHEVPSIIGILGVLLGVIGVYFLNISKSKEGFWEPFKVVIKERGSLVMLLVAFMFAITTTFDKVGIKNSDPVFYLIVSQLAMGILYIPLMSYKSKDYKAKIKNDWKGLLFIGLITTGALVAQFIAVKIALVPYVISLKRIAALFGVIYGGIMFKEEHIKERFIGALIMVIGVVLIAFA